MIRHPFTSFALCLGLAATTFSTAGQPAPIEVERTAVTTPLASAAPKILLATTPAVTAAGEKVDLQRASFTAEKTPPPPPPPVTPAPVVQAAPAAGEILASAPAVPVRKHSHTGTSAASPQAPAVVATAKSYLGVPYLWGGTDPSKGLDCSGLVQLVYRAHGITLPRVARAQATVGTRIPSLSAAKPGDLLGMRNGTHIAIYVGGGKILHAPRPGETVSIRALHAGDDIDTIRRLL